MNLARNLATALAFAGVVALGGTAAAQTPKLANKSYVDALNGYKFKPPAEWPAVPVLPNLQEMGMILRMDAKAISKSSSLVVIKLAPDEKGGRRPDITGKLEKNMTGFDPKAVLEEETETVGSLEVRHKSFQGTEIVFDTWTFPLTDFDVAIVFMVDDDKHAKRWLQLFRRSAMSFAPAKQEGVLATSDESSYEEQLAFHSQEAARTPGWRAIPTPSKKFILKTSSDNANFLDEVIERLEESRELYEADFPPEDEGDLAFVSVVRVCKTEEEFHKYGLTGGGVAGWFNPGTKELVLYDAKNTDRNMTYSVMSHEAFHQYCHFLFGESEAHRWFDEGHGDYYGGAEFKRGKATITPHMPSGLDRLPEIRDMIREGTYAPIAKHLNSNHQQWQTQGPTNVSCYAQSWSIIYMLRQGTLGKVPKKEWRPEYAEIIPNYVAALNAGFQKAYEEQDQKRREKEGAGKDEGETFAPSNAEREPITEARKQQIWKDAMEASWGKIDLDRFEKDWVEYVSKDLN